ncbi:MAG: TIGR03792 family protein [Chloroflexaceae bacterium]|nr:TIGR03792 family protein [Chloroflexaceae bacterium]
MVIEWLKFQVTPEAREQFIQVDEQVWTAFLSKFEGFLGKEVWISPKSADEVILVIHWQTREQWHAVPQAGLQESDREFARQMAGVSYQIMEAGEYQVRKFPI